MKKILFISEVDCSNQNFSGNKFAVTNVVNYLSNHNEVLYFNLNKRKPAGFNDNVRVFPLLGFFHALERKIFKKRHGLLNYKITFFSKACSIVLGYIYKPDVVIIEYLEYAYLSEIFKSAKVICDTHDIMHLRKNSYIRAEQNILEYFNISKDDELNALNKFDAVLAIQHQDYRYLCELLDTNVLLCPRASRITKKINISSSIKRFGFVGSRGESNLEAARWLIDNWPFINIDNQYELYIAGAICQDLLEDKKAGINLMGRVDDLSSFYDLIDITINPIYFGSGLKIKNIESICNGVPVLTTSIGLQGLLDLNDTVIFEFNDIEELLFKINALESTSLEELSERCFTEASLKFSSHACFETLTRYLEGI